MRSHHIAAFALVLCVSQNDSLMPVRIGEIAQRLTLSDVADLESALRDGRKPWLLVNDQGVVPNPNVIQVFLTPDTATDAVRRGTMILVRRERNRPEWITDDTRVAFGLRPGEVHDNQPMQTTSWVQVAIPGRSFDDVRDVDDWNRPFAVHGQLDDTTLQGVVEFLRSGSFRRPNDRPVQPITSIALLADGSLKATMRSSPGAFRWFVLERQANGWVVASRGGGVV